MSKAGGLPAFFPAKLEVIAPPSCIQFLVYSRKDNITFIINKQNDKNFLIFLDMTPEQFQKHIAQLHVRVDKAVKNDALKIIGNRATKLFKENYETEGFFGKPWAKLKHPKPGAKRKILVETSALKRSIDYRVEPGKVIIFSDVEYSRVHNEGGIQYVRPHHRTSKNGKRYQVRGYAYKMPKRQFIGDTAGLRKIIKDVIGDVIIQ